MTGTTASSEARIGRGRNSLFMVIGGLVLYQGMGAMEPAIVAILYGYGAQHMVQGRNPVTFCNILFIANLVSSMTMYALFHKDVTRKNLRRVTPAQWGCVSAIIVFGTILTQMLNFMSIEYTDISSVVLINALQIPLGAVVAAALFGETLIRRQIGGHLLIFGGILVPFLALGDGLGKTFNYGDLLALGAMMSRVVLVFLSKEVSGVPLGIIALTTGTVGSAAFFVVAYTHYGPGHFMDLMTPGLWGVVFLYTVTLVVTKRITKYRTFKQASRQNIVASGAVYPVLAVVSAALIAGQVPSEAQVAGIALLTAGIMLATQWRAHGASDGGAEAAGHDARTAAWRGETLTEKDLAPGLPNVRCGP